MTYLVINIYNHISEYAINSFSPRLLRYCQRLQVRKCHLHISLCARPRTRHFRQPLIYWDFNGEYTKHVPSQVNTCCYKKTPPVVESFHDDPRLRIRNIFGPQIRIFFLLRLVWARKKNKLREKYEVFQLNKVLDLPNWNTLCWQKLSRSIWFWSPTEKKKKMHGNAFFFIYIKSKNGHDFLDKQYLPFHHRYADQFYT